MLIATERRLHTHPVNDIWADGLLRPLEELQRQLPLSTLLAGGNGGTVSHHVGGGFQLWEGEEELHASLPVRGFAKCCHAGIDMQNRDSLHGSQDLENRSALAFRRQGLQL